MLFLLTLACTPDPPTTSGSPEVPEADPLFGTDSDDERALATQLAWATLDARPERFGHATLLEEKVQIDELGMAHVRFRQEHDGVEVFGGQLFVHLSPDGSLARFTDLLAIDVQPANDVLYTEQEAVELAVQGQGGWSAVTETPSAQLFVFRTREQEHRYAYRVRIEHLAPTGTPSIPVVFLDAGDGSVLLRYDDLQTGNATTPYNGTIDFASSPTAGGQRLVGAGVGTFDHVGVPAVTAWTTADLVDITSSDEDFSASPYAADVQWGVERTLDYFLTVHGRHGPDGSGGPLLAPDDVLTSAVHFGNNLNNAFWNGSGLAFGDGDGNQFDPLTSLDVVAHELTHGVTSNTSNLLYWSDPGAINESMSDVFAVAVERQVKGESPAIWTIGEDCRTPNGAGHPNDDALRYMFNPAADGLSAEHYTTRYVGAGDNEGVHYNSGIGNLAFYLASEGGTHPNPTHRLSVVDPLGIDRAAAIWYRANTVYLTQLSGYSRARQACVNAAIDLFGADSFEVEQIERAWSEVGVETAELNLFSWFSPGPMYVQQIDVPMGTVRMEVRTRGLLENGNLTLYVREGEKPTTGQYTCRSRTPGTSIEQCIVDDPNPGEWWLGVRDESSTGGYASIDVILTPGCYPGAPDEPGDGFDADCDGLDAACGTVASGSCSPDLVITELMVNPVNGDAAGGQWIEVLNNSATAVDLIGASVTTGAGTAVVDEHVRVDAGAYAVLAVSDDDLLNGGVEAVDDLDGLLLDPTSDTVALRGSGGDLLDEVAYGSEHTTGTSFPVGASISLDPTQLTTAANDNAFSWCDGRSAFGDGDFGTPGAANESCSTTIDFAFRFDTDGDGIEDDILDHTWIDFHFGPGGRWFTTGNGGTGSYTRTTTSAGQALTFTYDDTGVRYQASRAFGSDCFAGGTITGLPAGVTSGSWTATGCP